jgi:GH15 family glucan-1,4-alpha-glucosidase
MAWVAFDRAVRMHDAFGQSGPVEHWRAFREAIKRDVLQHGWNEELGTFTQSYGSRELDASLLIMPVVGFLPADDPRVAATVAAIERDLTVDGLVLRYRTDGETNDSLPPGEGVFLPCSFWLVEVMGMQGRYAEARALFERLIGLSNDVGLLAEEYDPLQKRQLGNFPQAFTHLSLVSAALVLNGEPALLSHQPTGAGKESIDDPNTSRTPGSAERALSD